MKTKMQQELEEKKTREAAEQRAKTEAQYGHKATTKAKSASGGPPLSAVVEEMPSDDDLNRPKSDKGSGKPTKSPKRDGGQDENIKTPREKSGKIEPESQDKNKGLDENTKKKVQADLNEFKRLQAELMKQKEAALKNKMQQEQEAKKAREAAEQKAKADTHYGPNTTTTAKLALVGPPLSTSIDEIPSDKGIHEEPDLKKIKSIIYGEKIFRHIVDLRGDDELKKNQEIEPKKIYSIESITNKVKEATRAPEEIKSVAKPVNEMTEIEANKGIIKYALSDRAFIEKGWTILPTEKVLRKMNVYRMRPAHPEFDWFEHNKNKRLLLYDSGEKLAEFDDKGRGRWYYRNGRLALDHYDAEEENAEERFVLYSNGEPDEHGRTHPVTILATFDYAGNGIVFDHSGKIRLKYNQTEGVVLDRGIGPVSHWKWHTLNDPPVLQQVMIDTQMSHKDPTILQIGRVLEKDSKTDLGKTNEDMLAIEFDNFIKEKSKKQTQTYRPFQIKMKALKINEKFSLRVLDQASIYLIFRDGTTNIKLNIGMILDHQEIVDTDTAEVNDVSNSMDCFPARTDSLAGLQSSVANAQQYEAARSKRERRIRWPAPVSSADQLIRAKSQALRPPLTTLPTEPPSGYCNCKKDCKNIYFSTHFI